MANPTDRTWTVLVSVSDETPKPIVFYSEQRAIEYIESMKKAVKLPDD